MFPKLKFKKKLSNFCFDLNILFFKAYYIYLILSVLWRLQSKSNKILN